MVHMHVDKRGGGECLEGKTLERNPQCFPNNLAHLCIPWSV